VLTAAAKYNYDPFVVNYLTGITQLHLKHLEAAEQSLDAATTAVIGGDESSLAISFALPVLETPTLTSGKKSEAVRLYEKALHYDPEDSETQDKTE